MLNNPDGTVAAGEPVPLGSYLNQGRPSTTGNDARLPEAMSGGLYEAQRPPVVNLDERDEEQLTVEREQGTTRDGRYRNSTLADVDPVDARNDAGFQFDREDHGTEYKQ